jgi:hypothetical protein
MWRIVQAIAQNNNRVYIILSISLKIKGSFAIFKKLFL